MEYQEFRIQLPWEKKEYLYRTDLKTVEIEGLIEIDGSNKSEILKKLEYLGEKKWEVCPTVVAKKIVKGKEKKTLVSCIRIAGDELEVLEDIPDERLFLNAQKKKICIGVSYF